MCQSPGTSHGKWSLIHGSDEGEEDRTTCVFDRSMDENWLLLRKYYTYSFKVVPKKIEKQNPTKIVMKYYILVIAIFLVKSWEICNQSLCFLLVGVSLYYIVNKYLESTGGFLEIVLLSHFCGRPIPCVACTRMHICSNNTDNTPTQVDSKPQKGFIMGFAASIKHNGKSSPSLYLPRCRPGALVIGVQSP